MSKFIEQVNEAEKKIRQAKSQHAARIREAKNKLREAEREHQKRVDVVERAMEATRAESTAKVQTCAGITLYKDRVVRGKTVLPLDDTIDVKIEASVNMRVNSAPIFITVASSKGQISSEGNLADEGEIRRFASHIVNYAKKAPETAQELNDKLAPLQQELDAIQADKDDIDAATSELARIEGDTSIVDAAEQELTDLKDQASDQQMSELIEHKESVEKSSRSCLIVFIIVVLVIIAVLFFIFR